MICVPPALGKVHGNSVLKMVIYRTGFERNRFIATGLAYVCIQNSNWGKIKASDVS